MVNVNILAVNFLLEVVPGGGMDMMLPHKKYRSETLRQLDCDGLRVKCAARETLCVLKIWCQLKCQQLIQLAHV